MPPLPKPAFPYGYDIVEEIGALREYRDTRPGRAIPSKAPDRLLLAIWNVANLGVHERREEDHRLIAEIVGWFDLIAPQERLLGLTATRSGRRRRPRPLVRGAAPGRPADRS